MDYVAIEYVFVLDMTKVNCMSQELGPNEHSFVLGYFEVCADSDILDLRLVDFVEFEHMEVIDIDLERHVDMGSVA